MSTKFNARMLRQFRDWFSLDSKEFITRWYAVFPHVKVTERFSNRADDYALYRPQYPVEAAEWLNDAVGLRGARVADIGHGTGIWADRLVEFGAEILAIEPNQPMLGKSRHPNRIVATAEATTLQDQSVDGVTAAQAAHWFEPEPTAMEWRRIVKPGGFIALVWNNRLRTPGYATDLQGVIDRFESCAHEPGKRPKQDEIPLVLRTFEVECFRCEWSEELNLETVKGRLRSLSRYPASGQELKDAEAAVEDVFRTYESNGLVLQPFETVVYLARV